MGLSERLEVGVEQWSWPSINHFPLRPICRSVSRRLKLRKSTLGAPCWIFGKLSLTYKAEAPQDFVDFVVYKRNVYIQMPKKVAKKNNKNSSREEDVDDLGSSDHETRAGWSQGRSKARSEEVDPSGKSVTTGRLGSCIQRRDHATTEAWVDCLTRTSVHTPRIGKLWGGWCGPVPSHDVEASSDGDSGNDAFSAFLEFFSVHAVRVRPLVRPLGRVLVGSYFCGLITRRHYFFSGTITCTVKVIIYEIMKRGFLNRATLIRGIINFDQRALKIN